MSGRESFSLQKVIQVRYRNESGVDEGGLKGDFFLYPHGPVAHQQLANAKYTDNVGYLPSANVLALQQGQYTTIGILTQCKRTGTATRPVYNDLDTHPVRTYWHCNKATVYSDRPHGGGDAAPRSGHATHLQPPVCTVRPVRMQATGDTCGKPRPADNS